MFDYEGSRSEFLKLLAECGEEPSFIARAKAPQIALDALLHICSAKSQEMLRWPTLHLTILAQQVQSEWSRLSPLLAAPDSVSLLEALHAGLLTKPPVRTHWLTSDKTALRRFLESAERYNRHWLSFVEGLDLEPVNKPRREFNQFYVLEKECAFQSEKLAEGFEPLIMVDTAYLYRRFPLLTLPALA